MYYNVLTKAQKTPTTPSSPNMALVVVFQKVTSVSKDSNLLLNFLGRCFFFFVILFSDNCLRRVGRVLGRSFRAVLLPLLLLLGGGDSTSSPLLGGALWPHPSFLVVLPSSSFLLWVVLFSSPPLLVCGFPPRSLLPPSLGGAAFLPPLLDGPVLLSSCGVVYLSPASSFGDAAVLAFRWMQ